MKARRRYLHVPTYIKRDDTNYTGFKMDKLGSKNGEG